VRREACDVFAGAFARERRDFSPLNADFPHTPPLTSPKTARPLKREIPKSSVNKVETKHETELKKELSSIH